MGGRGVQYVPIDVQAVRDAWVQGKKLDCGSKVDPGGEDLFMKITISGQYVDSSKAEATAAGRATYASGSGRKRRRWRGRWSTRRTAGAEVDNVRWFHQDRQRVRAA